MRRRRGVTVLKQRHDMDCGVAALAMYLGLSYGDMAAATKARYGSLCPVRRGLGIHHLEELTRLQDRKLKRIYRRKGYLDGRSGVLGIVGGDIGWCGHWVVLKNGVIVDPDDGAVWSVEDYCTVNKCRTATLLVEE